MRNVTVVVLDINPIETANCNSSSFPLDIRVLMVSADNIAYYKCDVSKWEEVETVAKRVIEDVRRRTIPPPSYNQVAIDRTSHNHHQQRRRCSRETYLGSNARGCETVASNDFPIFSLPFTVYDVERSTRMCLHTSGFLNHSCLRWSTKKPVT